MGLRVRFLGSGDAFGNGGRYQACILLEGADGTVLLDCGASSLIAMRRFGVRPDSIDAIVVSHLHGDHFGGIPFFVLDAQLVSKRKRPLLVAGPAGSRERIREAMEVFFPGSSSVQRAFALEIVEMRPAREQPVGPMLVTPYVVQHPSGAPALALRILWDGITVAYSGDTAWTEALVPVAQEADLLIAEAYYYEKRIPHHLDFVTLARQLVALRAKRVVVTHMSEDMLARVTSLSCESAYDGKEVDL